MNPQVCGLSSVECGRETFVASFVATFVGNFAERPTTSEQPLAGICQHRATARPLAVLNTECYIPVRESVWLMKRLLLLGTIVLGVGSSALTSLAGGCHGGGWCGGGWGGGWHGCGGSSWSFSLGIGFGGSYPAYSYPAYYPAYSYAYVPAPVSYSYVQPTYAYRTAYAQPVTVVTTTRAMPAASAPAYTVARTAPAIQQRVQTTTVAKAQPRTPAPTQPIQSVASAPKSAPSSGTWVLDKNPYIPPVTSPQVSQNPSLIVSRTTDSVPIYVVSR